MALVLNPENQSRVAENTETINVIPNQWGLIQQLGLFENQYKSQKVVTINRYTEQETLLVDRNWDERASTGVAGERDELTVKTPHFPYKDAITPNDLDGVVSFADGAGSLDLETVASARFRKMEFARKALSNTLEYARSYMITTGGVYAPSGTLKTSYGNTYNWYNEFGVSRVEVEVDLTDPAVNPKTLLDSVADSIADGYKGGGTVTDYIVLCSPEFFDALASHPYVIDSVKYIDFPSLSQNLLMGRLGNTFGLDARYESMVFGGMTYIRYRGSYGGNKFITAKDAYAFPRVDGMFRTFFAPEQTFTSINQTAQEVYWYEGVDDRGTMIEIEAESNFLNFMAHPLSVVRLYLPA